MDKEKLISIINTGQLELVIQMLMDYCIEEYKKPQKETAEFLQFIRHNLIIFANCINIVIEYYKKKFHLTEVIDLKTNKTILIY